MRLAINHSLKYPKVKGLTRSPVYAGLSIPEYRFSKYRYLFRTAPRIVLEANWQDLKQVRTHLDP